MITDSQLPEYIAEVFDEQLQIYKQGQTIQSYSNIPDTDKIPIENPNHWLKIDDINCVFVDMKGSTKLSATHHEKSTAGAYQLFTGTAVRLFHALDTPYIDVRGDGVFGLFNPDQSYRALVAAVSFKTFVKEVFTPELNKNTGLNIGSHIGIDRKTVLVRKVGLKIHDGRTDRQNEVWAGKPINMASKLAGIANENELLVSARYFEQIPDDLVQLSCGCNSSNDSDRKLWTEVDMTENDLFDFDYAYRLDSNWCPVHGKEYFENILDLDS